MTELNGIVPAIADALAKRGYSTLTPVQQAMLDPELADRDALVSAQTGSGKTVAFGMAIAPTLIEDGSRLGQPRAPMALVIAPTRELALQVKRELEWLYEVAGATIASCVGGMDIRNERRALERGAHIVVGTPGRLRDHITRGALDLSAIRAVVLDEADEMLDLGFREDLEFILEASPEERRTLLFSATVPRSIADLARSYQRNAVRIETASERKQHVDIDYRALLVIPADRENAIINVLRFYEARNAIVFCSTRAAVNHLTARMHNRGFSVVALSGELTQNERTHALQAMRDGRARVCIATDVAARGIDLPGLELVIHADLPTNSDTLLHRSGRTGRAGNKGVSAIIVPVNNRRKAERLLQNANVKAEWANPPGADEVNARDDERLLASEALATAPAPEETAAVAELLQRYDAETVAAAFVRLYRANRSAPEELAEVSLTPGARRPRDDNAGSEPRPSEGRKQDFGSSRWFSLSVGRRQNAEPRWLLPMICRHGQISKGDIGAIRMQPEETFVEIAADSAEHFLAALGPNKALERGIQVKPLDGPPDLSAPPKDRKPRTYGNEDRGFERKKPYGDDRRERSDRPAHSDRPQREERSERRPAPARGDQDMRAADNDVWGAAPAKPKRERGNDGHPRTEQRKPYAADNRPERSSSDGYPQTKKRGKPSFDNRPPSGGPPKPKRKQKSNS